ncbi:MAG: hypothetical protein OK436_04995 [Thaumarchaeota archaeon]|nr:hypothetical protein [Nitrososphaerota archaeon]
MTTRRDFLVALAGAVASVRLSKGMEDIVSPFPKDGAPLYTPHPAFWDDPFDFWKEVTIQEPGTYVLMDATLPDDFRLRAFNIGMDSSVHLSTLRKWIGEQTEDRSGEGYVVSLLLDKREYFRGPASFLPWSGGHTPIWPELLVPKGTVITMTAEGTERLDEPLKVQTLFSGIFRRAEVICTACQSGSHSDPTILATGQSCDCPCHR